jgi:hypothetical protein
VSQDESELIALGAVEGRRVRGGARPEAPRRSETDASDDVPRWCGFWPCGRSGGLVTPDAGGGRVGGSSHGSVLVRARLLGALAPVGEHPHDDWCEERVVDLEGAHGSLPLIASVVVHLRPPDDHPASAARHDLLMTAVMAKT